MVLRPIWQMSIFVMYSLMLASEEFVQTHLLDAFITSFSKFIFFGKIWVALKRIV